MRAARNEKLATLQTPLVEKHAKKVQKVEQNRRATGRRLIVLVIVLACCIYPFVKMSHAQNETIAQLKSKKESVEQRVAKLKREEKQLKREIERLNDDQYIAELARRDFLLSEKNEIIFSIPDEHSDE